MTSPRPDLAARSPAAEETLDSRAAAPRVLVAGHDSATLNGIRMALEEEGIVVCGRVASASELIDAVNRLEPDVCLVDVDIPGGGLVAAAEMRAWRSSVAVSPRSPASW